MIPYTVSILPLLALNFLGIAPHCSSAFLGHCLHPDAVISNVLDPDLFNESTACWLAVFHLKSHDVEDIQICEVTRIEAPVSGYLVDAAGRWDSGDGSVYSVFRTGILDGQDYEDEKGGEFVFLAAGFLANGDVFLYPEPVVTADSIYQFVSAHEFLMDRDEFFALPERYSR